MGIERIAFILAYPFKSYYDSDNDWRRDFNKFCDALIQFDRTHKREDDV